MYRLLSYPLNLQTPLYGDTESVQIKVTERKMEGDSCITMARITFSNHSGTHIDAPKHFYSSGRAIAQYQIEELIFTKPQIIDCPKRDNEMVKKEDLSGIGDCDLLLIRTGFYKFRSEARYRLNNPGISAKAAEWLRWEHPHVKAIGIDSISISSFQSREEGRKAHKIFLNEGDYPGQPVLLVEDMDLSFNKGKLVRVYVAPIFLEGVDSMPCTVIGEYE